MSVAWLAHLTSAAILLTQGFVLHGPIEVTSDALYAPLGVPNLAMGVRSGDGAPLNPYFIGGWLIVSPSTSREDGGATIVSYGRPGIVVRDTHSHVLFQNNSVLAPIPVVREANGYWPLRGVLLWGVENITIDGMYLENFLYGIDVLFSKNVVLRHIGSKHVVESIGIGYSEVVIEDSNFTSTQIGVSIGFSSKVVVRRSNFVGNDVGVWVTLPDSTLDARENWWGTPGGPNSPGADRVSGPPGYLVEPWLSEPSRSAGYLGH